MNRSRATRKNSIRSVPNHSALWPRGRRRRTIMNRQRRILGSIAVITALALLASAGHREDHKAVTVGPHKYIEGGHYMTVVGDSASAGKAIVFETDGKRVTMFRGGRLPEVKWVEGCS